MMCIIAFTKLHRPSSQILDKSPPRCTYFFYANSSNPFFSLPRATFEWLPLLLGPWVEKRESKDALLLQQHAAFSLKRTPQREREERGRSSGRLKWDDNLAQSEPPFEQFSQKSQEKGEIRDAPKSVEGEDTTLCPCNMGSYNQGRILLIPGGFLSTFFFKATA